jgi:DNA-binding LacI/PurR family transcriptional regulator
MNEISREKGGGVVSRIIESLRDHVKSLPEGTKLVPEPDLAQEFGVSRTTLRTALAVLHREGLVDRAPRRGTVVSRPEKTRPISACVISPFGGQKMDNGFYTSVMSGITQIAARDSVDLTFLLGSLGTDVNPRALKSIGWDRYDAALVFEIFERRCMDVFREHAKSVVVVDSDATQYGLTSICFDNRNAAIALGEKLMDMGHERFAFLGPRLGGAAWGDPSLIDRLRGIMDVVSRRGGLFLAQHIVSVESKDFKTVLAPILDVKPSDRPTAVVVSHADNVRFFRQAHEAGLLRVPDDISVMIFGAEEDRFQQGTEWGGAFFDGLKMGRTSLEVLRSQIINETPPGRMVLEGFKVEVGKSVGPVPKKFGP